MAFLCQAISREGVADVGTTCRSLGLAQTDNDLIARLLGEALVLLGRRSTTARQRIERALAFREAPKGRDFVTEKGVLPGWQLRKAVAFIQSELGTGLKIGDVARHVDLSASLLFTRV